MPSVLLAPYGGHAVDKYGANKILVVTGILEVITLLALSFATSTTHIYLLSAIMSGLFAFSGPSVFALIPTAAERAGLSVDRANSLIEVVGGMGAIIGPVLGGLSVGILSLSVSIQLTAAWSVLLVVLMYFSDLDSPLSVDQEKITTFFSQVKTSYKPVLRIRQIRFLFITFFAIVFSTTFSDVIFVFFVTLDLNGGPVLVGALVAAWSFGLTLGAWYLGKQKDPGAVVRFAYYGAIGMGVALFLTGLAASMLTTAVAIVVVAGLFVIGGFSNGMHNVAVRSSILKYVPQGQHGRAYSLYSVVTRVAAVGGYFSGGLAGKSNAALAYFSSGLLALAFGLIGLLVFSRFVLENSSHHSRETF